MQFQQLFLRRLRMPACGMFITQATWISMAQKSNGAFLHLMKTVRVKKIPSHLLSSAENFAAAGDRPEKFSAGKVSERF